MTDLSALNPQERLSYWTGVIVRNDVWLESTMRHLARSLQNTDQKLPGEPRNFDPLWRMLRETLQSGAHGAVLDAATRDAALAVMTEIKRVHRERVRFVHDMWAQIEGTEMFKVAHGLMGDWKRQTAPAVGIRVLEDVAHDQVIARLRLGAVFSAISALRDQSDRRSANVAFALALIRGEFTLLDDGGLKLDDQRIHDAYWGTV